ncbi:hypothetical protein DXG03_006795 [Asterophora parasitica]|uniref:PH domain-containing protein n=1 Tax=Asterophora parasitica TaxID=117018 RepID=A0A9P7G8G9_9AGAR|nr:hypothetical protein DXG03_006795 [Asterophora parasitica]
MSSNSPDPWSPQYGVATFTSFSDTQTPISPSRYSYTSRSDSQRPSSDGDDSGSAQQMRRITVSPSPSQSNSDSDAYTDDNSIDEVEATLNDLEDEFDDTEQALTEWSHGSSSGPSYTSGSRSYTGTYTGTGYTGSPSFVSLPTLTLRSAQTPPPGNVNARLSKITERTEESSRPNSGAFSASGTRPVNPTPETFRRSALLGTPSSHSRSLTDLGSDRTLPPPGRATELIAVFETSSPGGGHSRTASAPGVRPSSPFYSSAGYGYGSRPSSPIKSASSYTAMDTRPTGSTFLSPPPRPWTAMSGGVSTFRSTTPGGSYSRGTGSYIAPSYTTQPPSTFSGTGTIRTYTGTDSRTYTGTDARTYSGTETGTYSDTVTKTHTMTDTGTYTDTFTGLGTNTVTSRTPTSTIRHSQTSPRSPLTSVRNIVALWKERTPSLSKSPGKNSAPGSVTSASPPPDGDGLFGMRRRAQRANGYLQQRSSQDSDPITPTRRGDPDAASIRSVVSGHLPPGLDVADLLPYTQSNEAPLHIGLLWYLNVHDAPPYRWQRCQALLYPQLLLLSWLSPGGGRGIVALDLLNCTSVQSAPSPTHPSSRDDIGTMAARSQSVERDRQRLMDILVPFHMLYADGVERLAAESLLERQKWVNRLWEAVNRPIAMPDSSSVTRSPTGSIRTILSIDSRTSTSSTGSRSTVYVPPLRSLPSIPDFASNVSSTSSKSGGLSRRTSLVSSHHTRTVDDSVIYNQEYVYPGDPRAIQPSRTGSLLRRSGSMTDLDAEFASAVTRARGARPGLGFASLIFGGSPVTMSSGASLGRDVTITPPPSSGRGSDRAHSEVSDEQFFTASSEGTKSSYYSTQFSSELRTSAGLGTDATSYSYGTSTTGTHLKPTTISYGRTDTMSYLGDSQDSRSYTGTSPSTLSRTREVRRRPGRSSSRSYSSGHSDALSNKENLSGTYTPESGTHSIDSRSYDSRNYGSGTFTPSSGIHSLGGRDYSDSGSYTPSGSYSQSGSYTTDSSGFDSTDTLNAGETSETGYDICPSSDFTDLTGRPITSSNDSFTPSPSAPPPEILEQVSDVASEVGSEHFITASGGSSDYLTARSPSLKGSIKSFEGSESSYASFPTIPSESEYKTVDTGYSHYRTISEPSLGSEYITAEPCPTIPSEQNTPTLSSVKLSSEDDSRSVLNLPSLPPSEIPSIRSPSMFSDVLPPLPPSVSSVASLELTPSLSPPLPPLPPSLPSLSPTPSFSTPTEDSPDFATPSILSFSQPSMARSLSNSDASSSVVLLSDTISSSSSNLTPSTLALSSSPAPTEHASTPAPRLSSISSPTMSSVSSLSDLTPPFSEPPPPPSPHRWAEESDVSYESSQLAPSPSVISLAVPEGVDTSFDTSVLRPSRSGVSSVGRMTAIPETPTTLSTMIPHSPLPQLTPVPMPLHSISSSSDVRTPSALSLGSARSPLPALTPLAGLSPTMASSSDVDTPSSLDVTTPRSLSLSQSSLPTAVTPIPSLSRSVISNADVGTPSDLSLSDEARTPLARSLSNASASSFRSQASLSSSIFDSRSLFEEEIIDDIDVSTVPDLLTTPSQTEHQLDSPFSVRDNRLQTPDGSIVVTLSTPHGFAQTTRSSLRTQSSESLPTERDLSRDIDRIADDLRRYDDARGDEHQELADNVRALRSELRDLSEYLHRTPPPPPPPPPPQVQAHETPRAVENVVVRVNRMVGGSPVASMVVVGERGLGGSSLSRATSSASSIGSYLSSHHSDDDLLDSEASSSYQHSPVPWHAPMIPADSDESSSVFSDSEASQTPPYPDSSESSGRPFPPASPSPSSTSVSTVRPPATPPDLLAPINAIRDQLSDLRDGQNRMFDTLRGQPSPQIPEDAELKDRLYRIEGLLQSLIPREPEVVHDSYPEAPLSAIGSDMNMAQLNDFLRDYDRDQGIHAPVPTRQGPTLQETLDEMLSASMNIPPPDIQAPPDVVQLNFSRRARRTPSLVTIESLPPRPETEPPPQTFPSRMRNVLARTVPRAPLERPRRTAQSGAQPETSAEPMQVLADTPGAEQPPATGGVPPATGDAGLDMDMERELRRNRQERHPGTDGIYIPPAPPVSNLHPARSQTAPALGGVREQGPSWYAPRAPEDVQNLANVGTVPSRVLANPRDQETQPQPRPQTGTGSVEGRPQVIVRLPPYFDGMMEILRHNKAAQDASIAQQREMMRYMEQLNGWLQRNTVDRLDEMRGLNARVDELRRDIQGISVNVLPGASEHSPSSSSDSHGSPLGPARMPQGAPMAMPEPQHHAPNIQMPQPQHRPVIPQVVDDLPPGFVPNSQFQPNDPVIPPVIPQNFPNHLQGQPTPEGHHDPQQQQVPQPIIIHQPGTPYAPQSGYPPQTGIPMPQPGIPGPMQSIIPAAVEVEVQAEAAVEVIVDTPVVVVAGIVVAIEPEVAVEVHRVTNTGPIHIQRLRHNLSNPSSSKLRDVIGLGLDPDLHIVMTLQRHRSSTREEYPLQMYPCSP